MAHIEPVGKPKGRISALKSFRYASGISTPGEFNALCCALYVATHVSQPLDGYDAVYQFFYKTVSSLFHTLSITTLQSANAFSMPRGRS